jgi:uncharacterized protein
VFGISFWKVLLLVAVIAAVWFGYRWFQRWEKERRTEAARREAQLSGPQGSTAKARTSTEDMTACRVCGVYVAAGAARSCGRADCPFG